MWSLAITQPTREPKVAAALTRHGYDNLLFRVQKTVPKNGKLTRILTPAFPNYLFVNANSQYDRIRNSVSGVLGFVHFGLTVAHVPDTDISALKARATNDNVLTDIADHRFRKGQPITIDRGPFTGPAIYDRQTIPGRAIVFVQTLGRCVPVSINECDIAALPARTKRHRAKRQRQAC